MKLTKIISGGQTGADLGALMAAKYRGVPTGGFAPKGFITENGKRPQLKTAYGLKATKSAEYTVRTEANVLASDGTLVIAEDFNSPGTLTTLVLCRKHDKPFVCVKMSEPWSLIRIAAWIDRHNIRVLNVAGNRESKAEGIQDFAKKYLSKLINVLETDNETTSSVSC